MAPNDFSNLADQRSDGPGSSRNNERLARLRLDDPLQSVPGSHTRHADRAQVHRQRQPRLAKCLAAVAEWVGHAPRMQTPRLRAVSAMVETGGSPLVRRVGRILSRRRAPHRRTSRIAAASSASHESQRNRPDEPYRSFSVAMRLRVR